MITTDHKSIYQKTWFSTTVIVTLEVKWQLLF